MQSISDYNFSCNVTRSLTRLKSIFLNFDGQGIGENNTPGALPLSGGEARKSFNEFYHPSGDLFVKVSKIKKLKSKCKSGQNNFQSILSEVLKKLSPN